MRTPTKTAISALTSLDPLRAAVPGHGATEHEPTEAAVELQIARIMALPRDDGRRERRGFGLRLPPARHRNRPRYGVVGLAASAAIAVIATVLWVSPSAGAPNTQAGRPVVGNTQTRTEASISLPGYAMTDQCSYGVGGAVAVVR